MPQGELVRPAVARAAVVLRAGVWVEDAVGCHEVAAPRLRSRSTGIRVKSDSPVPARWIGLALLPKAVIGGRAHGLRPVEGLPIARILLVTNSVEGEAVDGDQDVVEVESEVREVIDELPASDGHPAPRLSQVGRIAAPRPRKQEPVSGCSGGERCVVPSDGRRRPRPPCGSSITAPESRSSSQKA